MSKSDIALMAHLMRRAGFGASREELESYVSQGYEATVEDLLHPERAPTGLEDEDIIRRYHVHQANLYPLPTCQSYWLRRMINTPRPLEEKVALFWHGVFATGYTKLFLARPSCPRSTCSGGTGWGASVRCWSSWPRIPQ